MMILCADDYAMTEGVSRAIGELAALRRLSATSAMVTSPHWPAMAPRLLVHRPHLSLGLHLNLTQGAPLGAMPRLAPGGTFPSLKGLLLHAFTLRIGAAEVRAEIERQLDCFEIALGFPPDHIDGHQHVQVLPGVRRALLDVVAHRYRANPPLLRDPSDKWDAIAARPATRKAATVALLARGFTRDARRLALPVNDSFGGFSDFDVSEPYSEELRRAFLLPGLRPITMCHPGHPDEELARIDSVVERRRMEYDALMREPDLPDRIWRPARQANGPAVRWPLLEEPAP